MSEKSPEHEARSQRISGQVMVVSGVLIGVLALTMLDNRVMWLGLAVVFVGAGTSIWAAASKSANKPGGKPSDRPGDKR